MINLSLIAVKLPFKTSVGFHNFLARGPINLQPFERNTLSKKFRFFQFLRGCVCRASMPAIPQGLLPSDSLDKKDTRGGKQPAEQRYDTLAVSLDTFIPFETILLRNARVTSPMQKLDAYLECFSTAEQKTGKDELQGVGNEVQRNLRKKSWDRWFFPLFDLEEFRAIGIFIAALEMQQDIWIWNENIRLITKWLRILSLDGIDKI